MKDDGIPASGKFVTDSELANRLLTAESKRREAEQRLKAVMADREQLLDEFNDFRNARPVPASPKVKPTGSKDDFVRVSAGDFHGMMHDGPAVAAFLADLRSISPDQVVLGGDIAECGGWLAKHQPVGFIALTDYSFQEDMLAANWILDEIQKAAPKAEILMLEGNHEDRVERWIVDQVMAHKRDAEFLYSMVGPKKVMRLNERGIQYFRRGEEHVPGLPKGWIKLGKMFYVHQFTGGKTAASRAVTRTGGHVTFFHTHQEDTATIVLPAIGVVKAFNPGCMCSRQPVWKNSDPSNWSHGYAVDFISRSENFLRLHVPIVDGVSMAGSMVQKFKSA